MRSYIFIQMKRKNLYMRLKNLEDVSIIINKNTDDNIPLMTILLSKI